MHAYFGLILISLAVAGSVFLVSHDSDVLKLPFPDSSIARPSSYYQGATSKPYVAPSPLASVYSAADSAPASDPAVRISSVRLPDNYWNFIEILLVSDSWGKQSADITGWTIRTKRGDFRIPQAQLIYEFGGRLQDIVLNSGGAVKINSGRGSKGNFRLNKCTGYLEDSSPFAPALPKSCPYISYAEVKNYSQSCQDYLLSLQACQNPLANPPVPPEDTACFDFLRKLNYNSCVAEHRNDEDFLDNEWRVWADNQLDFLNPSHDRVQLLDLQGRVVDEYIY